MMINNKIFDNKRKNKYLHNRIEIKRAYSSRRESVHLQLNYS